MVMAPVPRDGEAPASRSSASASDTAAPSTGPSWRSSSRAASPSTRRTAPAPRAPGSACGSRSTRPGSSRTAILALRDGALQPWTRMPMENSWQLKIIDASPTARLRTKRPGRDLSKEALDYLLYSRTWRAGRRPLPARPRREHVRGHVRGPRAQPGAAVPRDGLGVHQVGDSSGTWSSGRVPRAAASGSAGGPRVTVDGRNICRRLDDLGHRRARLRRAALPARLTSGRPRSRARCSRRSARGWASWWTSASTT